MLGTDLYARIKAAAQKTIQGLALPSMGGVYSQADVESDTTNIDYPCMVLTSAGLTETLLFGDSTLYQWLFPVNLFILDDTGKGIQGNESLYTGWRKAIFNTFHQRRMDYFKYLIDFQASTVEPRAIFDQRLPQYQRVRSSMLVKFEVFEDRS